MDNLIIDKISFAIQQAIYESLNILPDGLHKFDNWKQFQDAVNEIGWEHFVLYNFYKRNHAWKRNGHYVMNMNDPKEDTVYYAWIVDGKPLAITNIYIYPEEIYIGDFEVSKYSRGMGLGKKLFNAILNEYPNMDFSLCYRDEKAKQFWQKMGFIPNGNGRYMVRQIKGDD